MIIIRWLVNENLETINGHKSTEIPKFETIHFMPLIVLHFYQVQYFQLNDFFILREFEDLENVEYRNYKDDCFIKIIDSQVKIVTLDVYRSLTFY